ncbi:hypothetical protein GYMC52_0680 [Geobacillus sp. Y412MC52]|nr:hypothetical protein GYMC52_0680 [Geobacillus sp. Y412MC52]
MTVRAKTHSFSWTDTKRQWTQNVIFKFLRIIYNMNGERLSSFVLRYNPIPFLNHLLYTLVSPVLIKKGAIHHHSLFQDCYISY